MILNSNITILSLVGGAGWFNEPRLNDPRLIWGVAVAAVAMLLGTWLLARRRKGKLNKAAVLCGIVSILLHVLLIWLLPYTIRSGGGPVSDVKPENGSTATINMATFLDAELEDSAADSSSDELASKATISPLPIPDSVAFTQPPEQPPSDSLPDLAPDTTNKSADSEPLDVPQFELPKVAAIRDSPLRNNIDLLLADILSESFSKPESVTPQPIRAEPSAAAAPPVSQQSIVAIPASTSNFISNARPSSGQRGRVVGQAVDDFANRQGAARQQALINNGGDPQTEAAVEAGLKWLARFQRADGAWDPETSGAGIERSVLGQHRGGAGSKATTGISGLALMSLLGSGHTHKDGEHQEQVRKGLQYLLSVQAPDGSLAGQADPYAKTYSHGMAALAMCEASSMTRDPVALTSARSAVAFTQRSQHPTTGGWRYVSGDPGDMSQLGWQAMVLASALEAGIEVPPSVLERTDRFLRSVRAGTTGGLASYKPGEQPSRTMTAEALAIRLLLNENVPANEIAEAESYILSEPPGIGMDNYYYWYYASLALHQLQDDAWRQWNEKMKRRLLETQLPDGSWSTATVWGGYGGKVYTTSMACLCLEVYYRHKTVSEK